MKEAMCDRVWPQQIAKGEQKEDESREVHQQVEKYCFRHRGRDTADLHSKTGLIQLETTMSAKERRDGGAVFQHFVRSRNHENRTEIHSFGGEVPPTPGIVLCHSRHFASLGKLGFVE
jgi:hypothetical protein